MKATQSSSFNPQTYSRIGGALYLLLIFAGIFSVLLVRDQLVVAGDPAVTATNIIAHESLWRSGIACDLLMHLLDIPIMLIIYSLLRPVNKRIALLSLLFNVVQTAVLVANKLNLIATLLPLNNAAYLKSIEPQILYTQAYLSIRLHDIGFGVGLLFFGCTCLVNGWLVIRSNYLPKIIGVLLQIAGMCYLVSNTILIMAPSLATKVSMPLMVPCLVAELFFACRLLFKGVDIVKWNQAVAYE